jgi:chemotaxis methyl-accepting protein methylase
MTDDRNDGIEPPRPAMVVGIGASAGGLAALKAFFATATPDPRIAYVVVTHLPSRSVSHLAELLSAAGAVPAVQVEGPMPIEGGRAYVAPPGRLLLYRDGRLELGYPPDRPPAPKPIDLMMLSLAEGQAERSVGIVLSGTDHDGTNGLKAIRAAGGLAYVQRPESAQFESMPRSALDAGAADRVLEPSEMPAALLEDLAHRDRVEAADASRRLGERVGPVDDALERALRIVFERTGHDFRWYRPAMLRRRLARRMMLAGVDRVDDYLARLEASADEAQALKSEFLIGYTEFFRDREAWVALEREVVPALLAAHRADAGPIRVWTPGCATGEEAYSIAMLLLEQFDGLSDPPPVQVFATDIDLDALAFARAGSYPSTIAASVSPQRLARFFERRGDRWVARKALRDAVLFAPQSLVRDTPFSKLDLILCRNLLIYFETELQERVFEIFHFSLRPQGFLLLGRAESLGSKAGLFEAVDRQARLFRRIGARAHLPRGFVGGWSGLAGARLAARRTMEQGGGVARPSAGGPPRRAGARGRGADRSRRTRAAFPRIAVGDAGARRRRDARARAAGAPKPAGRVARRVGARIRRGAGDHPAAAARRRARAATPRAVGRTAGGSRCRGAVGGHRRPGRGGRRRSRGGRRRRIARGAAGHRRRSPRSPSGRRARRPRVRARRGRTRQRGASGGERGDTRAERGAAVVERGTREREGGAAGAQRGALDGQRAARGEGDRDRAQP